MMLAMPETPDLFNEVAIMRDELEDQGSILDALVRASGADKEILRQLAAEETTSRVLLAVDGVRTQNQIATHLGLDKATVSRSLKRLRDSYGLVTISHRDVKGKVYHRTRLDRALHISRQLQP